MAAELRAVTRTSMPAEPLRPATSNHPFLTHAARTVQYAALWRAAGKRAVERSEERLVVFVTPLWVYGLAVGVRWQVAASPRPSAGA